MGKVVGQKMSQQKYQKGEEGCKAGGKDSAPEGRQGKCHIKSNGCDNDAEHRKSTVIANA